MATISTKIPAVNIQIWKDYEQKQVKAKLDYIASTYAKYISKVSDLCKVPEKIITSFIFIESAGQPHVASHAGAYGLMQLQPASATDVVYLEEKTGRLTDPEKAYMISLLGAAKVKCMLSMKYLNQHLPCNNETGVSITITDLYNPEINIFLGTMMLSQYIDIYTENGIVRWDKVVVAYNTGKKTIKGDTIAETMAGLPTETHSYIAKLLGVGGTLSLLA